MNITNRAREFAIAAHEAVGQTRKYSGEPYWHHPQRVAEMIADFPASTEEMIAAAWLHDVVEDTGVSLEVIRERFGETVALYVGELTNVPADAGNRATRFKLNTDKLAAASSQAQTIKLADLIDNTASVVQHDLKFASVYLAEKQEVLKVLTRGNVMLWWRAQEQVQGGLKSLLAAS
jgi:(p)ppGpp synthase/HD superfamily hydrolase